MQDYKEVKVGILKQNGTLNRHATLVAGELFLSTEFFDPQDLVMVRYEMLRRVRVDGWSVERATKAFGFSRVTFYQLQAAFEQDGLSGLMPRQRGPQFAHKLNDKIMDFVILTKASDKKVKSVKLSQLVQEKFGISVHPRSIERAIARRLKKGL
ncbi:MAG: helix-turn-helix domain containing protein [Phycisphaerae bacterium]|nr:helix-turn-helix domain containing protein [Phycisphaerae bacterium]